MSYPRLSTRPIAAAILIFALAGPVRADDPPTRPAQTYQTRGLTAGASNEGQTGRTHGSGSLGSTDFRGGYDFTSLDLGGRFSQIKTSELRPGITILRKLDASTSYQAGVAVSRSRSTDTFQNAEGEWVEAPGRYDYSRGGQRVAASGSGSFGALFGRRSCGPYAAVGASGSANRASRSVAWGPTATLGAEAEAGVACTGRILATLTATAGAHGSREHGEGLTSEGETFGLKLDAVRDNLRVRASVGVLRERTNQDPEKIYFPLYDRTGYSGERYSAGGSYTLDQRLFNRRVTVDGDVYVVRGNEKRVPGMGSPGELNTRLNYSGASVRAVVAF